MKSKIMLWRKSRKRRSQDLPHLPDANDLPAKDALSESWRVENIIRKPPSSEEWWHTNSATTCTDDSSTSVEADEKEFFNCGLSTWEESRRKWTCGTAKKVKNSCVFNKNAVAQGLATGNRTFELPGRISLKEIVDVFTGIWSGQD